MHTRYPRPDISIKLFEDNFGAFLDLKSIKDYIPLTDYDKYEETIHELCVTTSSIYLILDRLQNAQDIIKKGKELAQLYGDEFLKAKLLLIEVSRLIKLNQTFH
jgi:hypothetical protein